MCKLLNILWLDTYSYNKITIPNPVRIWKNYEGPDR